MCSQRDNFPSGFHLNRDYFNYWSKKSDLWLLGFTFFYYRDFVWLFFIWLWQIYESISVNMGFIRSVYVIATNIPEKFKIIYVVLFAIIPMKNEKAKLYM